MAVLRNPVVRALAACSLAASIGFAQQAGAPTAAPANPQSTAPAAAPAAQTTPEVAAPQAGSDSAALTIRAFVPEVPLVFTVTDGKGRFVTGLKQSDFGLLDDGRKPDRIISFTQQANLPLRIGILLDTSNSIRSRFQFEQQAATEFLLQVLRPKQDAAFVLGFDVRQDLAQDYTNSIDKLSSAIEKLRPGGGTAFFDAVYTTCRDQMLTVKSNETIRKAIIIVSDGEDNYSRVYEQDAIKECQRAETIVYTISTNVSPSKDKGDEVLSRLSDATGGRAFFPTKIEDVARGFQAIQEELRSQYSLRYRPAGLKQDGSFRTIYLTALDQRYHVRARKGYFSPRAPQ
ncbi:VWA domain-containing protein [Terriglobus roseus]|uniref:VWFA-related domain-containing protein n=1 Tax=Terriglobus roseus TaxID=392734 RepID=A0A1H4LAJ0_9BACT|nr:VWA domain-containing protein [Terriglobus roseus]SEB67761.1 VWFA-related domain-containing protein [Terriglobus roseus]